MSRAAAAGMRCCWRARASTCAPSIAIRKRSRSCAIPPTKLGLAVDAEVVDLETDPPPAIATEFDAIVVFNYLHRPLVPALRAALKPGGRIFYETFTTRQAERGHPTNPAFLLRDGELNELMAPLTVLRSREGEFDGRFIASIVAEPLVS